MFDEIGGFFSHGINGIKGFFSDAYSTVKGGVVTVYDTVTNKINNVVGTVHTDVRDYFKGGGKIINNVVGKTAGAITNIVDKTEKVIEHGQDTIGNSVNSLGQSFSMPLAIVGGILGFYYISKR